MGEMLLSAKKLDVRRVHHLVIAGWTGRDAAAIEKHIRELEAIGVKRPRSTPVFYRVAASLLTTEKTIEVIGDYSSGEAECVVYSFDDGNWIGLGSDHTDRATEAVSVSLSKQMCAKPVSNEIWRLEDVAPHWDELVLRSYVGSNENRRLYQEDFSPRSGRCASFSNYIASTGVCCRAPLCFAGPSPSAARLHRPIGSR